MRGRKSLLGGFLFTEIVTFPKNLIAAATTMRYGVVHRNGNEQIMEVDQMFKEYPSLRAPWARQFIIFGIQAEVTTRALGADDIQSSLRAALISLGT